VKPLVSLVALCGLACATARPVAQEASNYPTVLTPPSQHPGEFLRRQRLVARYMGQTMAFDAVLQKKGDVLTLIGLTPFGAKAFALVQTGVDVKFTPFLMRETPFPPENIMKDIYRTYFLGISEGVLPDGLQTAYRDGERIQEVWAGGRLQERRFMRLVSGRRGEIVVTYVGGMADGKSPAQIEFHNGWFGYDLSISTVSEEAL